MPIRMSNGQKYKGRYLYIDQQGLRKGPCAPCGLRDHWPSSLQGPVKCPSIHDHHLGREKEKEI